MMTIAIAATMATPRMDEMMMAIEVMSVVVLKGAADSEPGMEMEANLSERTGAMMAVAKRDTMGFGMGHRGGVVQVPFRRG